MNTKPREVAHEQLSDFVAGVWKNPLVLLGVDGQHGGFPDTRGDHWPYFGWWAFAQALVNGLITPSEALDGRRLEFTLTDKGRALYLQSKLTALPQGKVVGHVLLVRLGEHGSLQRSPFASEDEGDEVARYYWERWEKYRLEFSKPVIQRAIVIEGPDGREEETAFQYILPDYYPCGTTMYRTACQEKDCGRSVWIRGFDWVPFEWHHLSGGSVRCPECQGKIDRTNY